ncbi:MAG: NAD(P)-dependent glycerol-3-phosphate dehydrogenase, partial [Desulfobacteraceae bacterium]
MKSETDSSVRIGVVGAGSWGTAIANLLANKGFRVDFWVYEKEVKDQIEELRENRIFLPGISLSSNISPSNDIANAVSNKDLVVLVVPSHVMRETAKKMSGLISANTAVVSASKGIENNTYLTMTGVLAESIPDIPENNFAALSGPSFAGEVARNVPTAVTVASKNNEIAAYIQRVFATPFFRVYTNDDVTGVELGGAVKNVIAIAAGVIDGLGLGLNTRAALITRGLT